MFELIENYSPSAVIKVIGVGGGGGNAVNQMVEVGIEGVDFVSINTDAQALRNFQGKNTLQIGGSVTKGLGAGANPEVGRQAALEDRDRIQELLKGSDMVFLTAGMGGGTGTGAAPVIAQAAKEMGILTVAVVTKPFPFEGQRRAAVAAKGIEELTHHVDSLITIPNAKLLSVLGGEITLLNAFRSANDVLSGAVQGIAELITRPGLINVDFADVRTVMSEMGMAMMGAGVARGEDRALMAANAAVGSPLLEDVDLSGALGLLVNITAGLNLSMREFEEIGSTISDLASDDATVVIGTVIDPDMEDELRVTVVATGLGEMQPKPREKPVRIVRNATTGAVETPANKEAEEPQANAEAKPQLENKDLFENQADIDFLDIPAFLRTQAD
ncbi:MAG: cell division protein FtsZ [Xanthomonadales bacterium]|jgi:cell division protein FtsZ|nr:cell division protein FtsZ [Xanthomonadales bacterium]